jgi:hypothetical protein
VYTLLLLPHETPTYENPAAIHLSTYLLGLHVQQAIEARPRVAVRGAAEEEVGADPLTGDEDGGLGACGGLCHVYV